MKERGMRITPCMADRLLQRCNKSDWRLFHLLAGEGIGAISAEDVDDTFTAYNLFMLRK